MISPFLKARGAAWVLERREMAATVIAAEESFMLVIDWEFGINRLLLMLFDGSE